MPRPIFIVGSPRSGTSILTWSIGQHPNVLALEETAWMGPLSLAIAVAHANGSARGPRSQLSAMDVTREEMMEAFGRSIDEIVVGHRRAFERRAGRAAGTEGARVTAAIQIARGTEEPKARWVDGTPENSFHIYALSLLFPQARFIHLLRDPHSVARSLIHFHSIGGARYTPEAAYREWLRTVSECGRAERGLGSDRMLRVTYDDLTARSEQTLRMILEFVGEDFSPLCVAALGERINSSGTGGEDGEVTADQDLVRECEALALRLAAEPIGESDPAQLAAMQSAFAEQAFGHGLSPAQRHLMRQAMPRDALVLVASDGHKELLSLEGRSAVHFPQDEEGRPIDVDLLTDEQLVEQLERLAAGGAQFLLVPKGGGDRVARRAAFAEHLLERHTRAAAQDGIATVWELNTAAGGHQRP